MYVRPSAPGMYLACHARGRMMRFHAPMLMGQVFLSSAEFNSVIRVISYNLRENHAVGEIVVCL